MPDNTNRTVVYDPKTGRPVNSRYQDPNKRIPPRNHY